VCKTSHTQPPWGFLNRRGEEYEKNGLSCIWSMDSRRYNVTPENCTQIRHTGIPLGIVGFLGGLSFTSGFGWEKRRRVMKFEYEKEIDHLKAQVEE
jgi:hypothetical protein